MFRSLFSKNEAADDLFREEFSLKNKKQTKSIVEINDNSTWYKTCPPSYRGVCVIHLTSTDSGYSDVYLQSIANSHSKDGSIASNVALMHVNGDCKLPFTEQFEISSSNLPTMVAYAPFKERYAVFRGSLSEVSVKLYWSQTD